MSRRRRIRRLLLIAVGTAALAWLVAGPIGAYLGGSLRWASSDYTFLFKPYIQIGDAPALSSPERAEVLWHAADREADWWVEVRPSPAGAWVRTPKPGFRRVLLTNVEPHRVYHVPISGLTPGERFGYRVGIGSRALFEAEARARPPAGRAYRAAIIGDIAAGTSAASRIAYRIGETRPDLLVVTGDIVYSQGRISEYSARFFPVYNADAAMPSVGSPLLRTTLSFAAGGNHDFAGRDFGRVPDPLEYFLAWSQPLNGPIGTVGAPSTPEISGPADRREAFLAAAGPTYPRMANFSLDFGDVHWTVLDANPYVDWTDPALRDWVERDLASAPSGAWRLVVFHQPGFNSSSAHFDEQQMRLLADVFERGGVAIAFGGHVHQYQRTKPLTFAVRPQSDGRKIAPSGRVDGIWTLDRDFDGVKTTVPRGVIYVITGAGGATLHDPGRQDLPRTWLEFTERLVSNVHSFTLLEVERDRLLLRQLDESGTVVDTFTVTRPGP
jgi:hypothetical protein